MKGNLAVTHSPTGADLLVAAAGMASQDFFLGNTAYGTVAQKLLNSGMDPNALRTLATLRKDEWIELDKDVAMAAEERLVGVADLIERNLIYDLMDGFGTTVFQSSRMGDMSPAERTMDGVTRTRMDRVAQDIENLPLPITHKDFGMTARELAISRKNPNTALDTSNGQAAARQVAESLEDMLFNGAGLYTFGGGTIYGYTDFPQRSTLDIGDWSDTVNVSGATILANLLSMISTLEGNNFYGPYILYVARNFSARMSDDFKTNSDRSIRERLGAVDGIEAIKVAPKLASGAAVLVQMTTDVVRMIQGMDVTTVEWEGEGGMALYFKVMTIQVPQIRANKSNKTGIVHAS